MNPYLAEETIVDLIEEGLLDKDFHTAVADYTAAVLHGVVKIASKWASPPSCPTSLPRSSRRWAYGRM